MKPLPMPIRIAAGLVVTALEEAQQLPRKLVELPVTAVSQALQVSMRVQQRVTELAIKGDRALSALRPVPESPEWARFDEDEELPARPNGLTASSSSSTGTAAPPKPSSTGVLPDSKPEATRDTSEVSVVSSSELPVPRRSAERRPRTTRRSTKEKTTTDQAGESAGGPPELPDYEQWTLAQLRARLRRLSLEQLEQLLEWETTHQSRPPFVTMLSNRIANLRGQ